MNAQRRADSFSWLKTAIAAIAVSAFVLSMLVGCVPEQQQQQGSSSSASAEVEQVKTKDLPLIEDTNFGGVLFDISIEDFNAYGFNLGNMLRFLAGVDDDADLSTIDYAPCARDYLIRGGMTDEQIDALVSRLTA